MATTALSGTAAVAVFSMQTNASCLFLQDFKKLPIFAAFGVTNKRGVYGKEESVIVALDRIVGKVREVYGRDYIAAPEGYYSHYFTDMVGMCQYIRYISSI